jgi:hypothetical protein
MDDMKLIISIFAVVVSGLSFIFAWRTDARSKKAEAIKNLLGQKESVAYAALKLLREGLPKDSANRRLVLSALMQASVFEASDRARSLVYRVVQLNRVQFRSELRDALMAIKDTFESMKGYGLTQQELDLGRGYRRIGSIEKIIQAA